MNDLERIVNFTGCNVLDALDYLNAQMSSHLAYLNGDKELIKYLEIYKQKSDLVYLGVKK